MKIGIIGAGNIGGALAKGFSKLGHDVVIANSRGPETLTDVAERTGATAVSVSEAAVGQAVVIVTIPMKNIETLPETLFAHAASTVVIDTNNYYPQQRDGAIADIEGGLTESRWVSKKLNHPVIKVFNNIYAEHLESNGKPSGTENRIALPVAGDDPAAKQVVMQLVDDLGFDPCDAGSIDESWRQQPGTPAYTTDLPLPKLREALAAASPDRSDEWRAKPGA